MIDTKKPIRAYDDRNKVDEPAEVIEILFEDDEHILCITNACVDQPMLIRLKDGAVLNGKWQYWYAENYKLTDRDDLISAIISHVGLNHPKVDKHFLNNVKKEMEVRLPVITQIQKYIQERPIGRDYVEKFIKTDVFDVRTHTLIAKAISKYFNR